jgi:hypothetical protein
MGFGISPVDGGGQIQNSQQSTPINTQEVIAQFNEASKVMDTEVQAFDKRMLGVKSNDQKSMASDVKQMHVRSDVIPEMAEEALQGELAKEQLVDRTKRKKTKWEEKMDEMAALEGQLAMDQLQGEEKGIFQEFFDNMARIKSLRAKLKQLEQKEEEIEEEKKRKKREEDQKRFNDAQKQNRNGL